MNPKWSGDLILVDASNLLFRLTVATTTPRCLMFAFFERIVWMRRFYGCRIELCLEGSDNWRLDHHPEYKGTRDRSTDEALCVRTTIELLKQYLPYTNLVTWDGKRCEGDDVMGAVAMRAALGGESVAVFSTDKDLLQLLDDELPIVLLQPTRQGLKVCRPTHAKKELGVDPCLLPDLKGLQGDRGDNIPGVLSFGPIRSQELIERYGCLENLIEVVTSDELDRKEEESAKEHILRMRTEYGMTVRQIKQLREQVSLATMSKKVGVIDTDVEVWVREAEPLPVRDLWNVISEEGRPSIGPSLCFELSQEAICESNP